MTFQSTCPVLSPDPTPCLSPGWWWGVCPVCPCGAPYRWLWTTAAQTSLSRWPPRTPSQVGVGTEPAKPYWWFTLELHQLCGCGVHKAEPLHLFLACLDFNRVCLLSLLFHFVPLKVNLKMNISNKIDQIKIQSIAQVIHRMKLPSAEKHQKQNH